MEPSPLPIDPTSLDGALERVADGRKRRGKRDPLALILTLVLLGKLAGETSIAGTVEWITLRQQWLRQALNWPRRFPSLATFPRSLAACDAEELAHLLAQVMLKAQGRPTD